MKKNNSPKVIREKVYHVGNEKYVTVTDFRRKKSVYVGQFNLDRHNRRRVQKGLELTMEEWKNLITFVTNVADDTLEITDD